MARLRRTTSIKCFNDLPTTKAIPGPGSYLNDDSGSITDVIATADGEFIVFGTSTTCTNDGSDWTGDVDWFELEYGCTGAANALLEWSVPADLDLVIADSATSSLIDQQYSVSMSSPEESNFTLPGNIIVGVLCWDGPAGLDWTMTLSF